jgi:DNA invertase Pin-like site-specific DNA recombinase
VATPRVFGYVRVTSRHRARVERWRVRIADYCRQEGLALELVFADAGVSDTVLERAGWTALLDVVRLNDAPVVVVLPNDYHLSREPGLQVELRAQLAAAGAAVVVMPARARLAAVKAHEG